MFGFEEVEPFHPTQWLDHHDQVTVGDLVFEVLFCPGHTPGHVVFYNRTHAVAFVGDVLFDGSIGRTDFPRGNHQQLLASIWDHLMTLPDDVRFVPGHGPMSTIGEQRKTNPYLMR